jgi:hypothetical protein
MSDNLRVEAQPSGVSIERTLDVVAHILSDADFSNEVAVHNGWSSELSVEQVAVLFLACRYQWAVDLLGRQTATLKREVNGLTASVRQLEDQLSGRN